MIGGSSSGKGWEFFSSPPCPDRLWVPEALFLGVKRPGREANHSSSSSADIKNAWSYTSAPNTPSWCRAQLKKKEHLDNFTLPYLPSTVHLN
jgi:hypothetical protein